MKPPRLAEWFVLRSTPPDTRDALRADLAEEYGRRLVAIGPRAARAWYWRQVRRSVPPLLRARLLRSPRASGDARGSAWREATRSVLRHPRVSAVCIVTLALASCAALAAGTIVHTMALRELPFPDSNRVVALWNVGPALSSSVRSVSFQDLEDWRARSSVLDFVSGEIGETFTLTGRGEPRRISAVRVARDFDRVLAVRPLVGRLFEPGDFDAGAHYVAVLSHSFWRQEFGASISALGETVTLDDRSYLIVGVLPPMPTSLPAEPHELWVPLIARPGVFWENSRGTTWLNAVGRLKPGVPVDAARAELSAVAAALSQEYPGSNAERVAIEVQPLRNLLAGTAARPLLLLASAVAAVLLVAWANLINLMMTHATTRRREFAVRLAIGADRHQVISQILVESAIAAGVGAALGLGLVPALLDGFVSLYPGTLWRAGELTLGPGVIAGAAVLAVTGAGLLAIPQARYLAWRDLTAEVRHGQRVTSSPFERRARMGLVATQVAFSVVLLTAGVVFARTYASLGVLDTGVDTDDVVVFEVSPSRSRFASAAQAGVFFQQVREALQSVPGVRGAGAGMHVPIAGGSGWSFPLGRNATPGNDGALVRVNIVSPDYFEVLGIRIVQGRPFSTAEHQRGGPAVVMVNETLARLLRPMSETGGRMDYDGTREIVGVVANTFGRPGEAAPPVLYMPWHNAGTRPQRIAVRTAGDPLDLLPSLSRRIHAIDPAAPISNVVRLREALEDSLAPQRFRATMLAALSALALVLAALGAYSVTAFTLAVQERENGIRRALGEPPRVTATRILGTAVVPAAAGALLGAGVAAVLAPSVQTLLHGVSARDPVVIGGVAALLLVVAGLASALPARSAMRVDPAVVLRLE